MLKDHFEGIRSEGTWARKTDLSDTRKTEDKDGFGSWNCSSTECCNVSAGASAVRSSKLEETESEESWSLAVTLMVSEPSSEGDGVPVNLRAEESKESHPGRFETAKSKDAFLEEMNVVLENDHVYVELTRAIRGSWSANGYSTETEPAMVAKPDVIT